MRSGQNDGPFLDRYYNTAPNIQVTQKRAIISTFDNHPYVSKPLVAFEVHFEELREVLLNIWAYIEVVYYTLGLYYDMVYIGVNPETLHGSSPISTVLFLFIPPNPYPIAPKAQGSRMPPMLF